MKNYQGPASLSPVEYIPGTSSGGYEFTAPLEDTSAQELSTETLVPEENGLDESYAPSENVSETVGDATTEASESAHSLDTSVVRKTIDAIHAGRQAGQERLEKEHQEAEDAHYSAIVEAEVAAQKAQERGKRIKDAEESITTSTSSETVARYAGESYEAHRRRIASMADAKLESALQRIDEEMDAPRSEVNLPVKKARSAVEVATARAEKLTADSKQEDETPADRLKLPEPPEAKPSTTAITEQDSATHEHKEADAPQTNWAQPVASTGANFQPTTEQSELTPVSAPTQEQFEARRREETLADYPDAIASEDKKKTRRFRKSDLMETAKQALTAIEAENNHLLNAWEEQSGETLDATRKKEFKKANSRRAIESMLLHKLQEDNKEKWIPGHKDKLITVSQLVTLSDFIVDRYLNGKNKAEDKKKTLKV